MNSITETEMIARHHINELVAQRQRSAVPKRHKSVRRFRRGRFTVVD